MDGANLRIAIIGGGPGGLCTAIALHRKGFKNVSVYERDGNADARKQGYSFSLRAPVGGLGFINHFGLYDEVKEYGFDVHFRFLDGPSDSTLVEFLTDSSFNVPGEAVRRFMRPGLRNVLVKVCQKEGIRVLWNSKYINYEENENCVLLNFEGQPSVEADVVTGADGLHSKIREQLLEDFPVYTGFSSIYCKLLPNDSPQLFEHPMIKESGGLYAGPDKTFFFFHHKTKHTDELHWIYCERMPEGELKKLPDNQSLLKFALEAIKDWPGISKEIVQATPASGFDSIIEYKDRVPLEVTTKTGRACNSKSGRITLLGDAAHPMLPFKGAGGNNAMVDAWKLSDLLGTLLSMKQVTREDINKVLSAYEKEMTIRGGKAVLESRKAAEGFHATGALACTMRNMMFRAIHWRINTYGRSKYVRWAVKSAMLGLGVAVASAVLSHFNVTQNFELSSLLQSK